jgi:Ala-tRNA(Pro) deacylase
MLPKPVTQLLEQEKVPYEVMSHQRAFTAQAVAASLHVSGRDFAKPVIVKTQEGRMLMAVVPGPRHVDLKALSGLIGVPVELAHEDEMERLFPDCELGAEPPFGNLYGMPVYVDASLSSDPEIVFNAGSHSEAVRMKYADYARLVHPAVARISLGH